MGSLDPPGPVPSTDPAAISIRFSDIFRRFENMERLTRSPPVLAHYTSIEVAQKILDTETVWFSNPLFMNDIEEMRFGMFEGARLFSDRAFLASAAGSDQRALVLEQAFIAFHTKFMNEGAFDTYIFCLSEHDPNDLDGLLSMWRGYGLQGKGAALLFDVGKMTWVPGSPLRVTAVTYADTNQRLADLQTILNDWARVLQREKLPDHLLYVASWQAYQAILTYALTTKHKGFSEEREWRIIYHPDNDFHGLLKPCLDYAITSRGVEPKLKYKIGFIANVSASDLALDKILFRIILGPMLSSPLAVKGVQRMLERINKPHYKDRLVASSIPFRPTDA